MSGVENDELLSWWVMTLIVPFPVGLHGLLLMCTDIVREFSFMDKGILQTPCIWQDENVLLLLCSGVHIFLTWVGQIQKANAT